MLGKPKPREKMPAILVASKMKSGLPKPVHSAAPILHVPPARAGPQPCYLKLGSKVEVSKTAYPSQIPLKSQGLQEPAGEGLPLRKSGSVENGLDTQVRGAGCRGTVLGGWVHTFFGEGWHGWMRERDTLWLEEGNVLLRSADWGMREESGLAGGCGPGA